MLIDRVAHTLWVNPSNDSNKVSNKALDAAFHKNIIANDDRLLVNGNSVCLVGN